MKLLMLFVFTLCVFHVQVSDRRFVSCSDDGCIRIWDLHTDRTTSLSSVF